MTDLPPYEKVAANVLGTAEKILRFPAVQQAYDKITGITKVNPAPEDVKSEYAVRNAMLDGRLPSIINHASQIAAEAAKFEHTQEAGTDTSQLRRLITLRDSLNQVSSLLEGKEIGDVVHDHTAGSWTPGSTKITWPSLPSVKVKKAGTLADSLIPVGTVDVFPPEASEYTQPADGRKLNRTYYEDLDQFARTAGWKYENPFIVLPDERQNVIDVEVSDEGDVKSSEDVSFFSADVFKPDAIDRGNAYAMLKEIKLYIRRFHDHYHTYSPENIEEDLLYMSKNIDEVMDILKGEQRA